MITTKREDLTKQGFCDTLKKTPSLGKFLISTYSIFGGWQGNGGGHLFKAGRLLTFSAFRMDVYSRWALIRGWALIRIYVYIFIFKFN